MITLSQEEIFAKIDTFNWNFKVGYNIKYNVQELFFLYRVKNNFCSVERDKGFANKHLSMTLFAVTEGILHDFVVRLSEATNYFPRVIDSKKQEEIKKYIARQKVLYDWKDLRETRLRVKNYTFSEILKLLKKFELLGPLDGPIYENLVGATQFRNRVHIYNWHNNFERNENDVFTDERLGKLEKLFVDVLTIMETKYFR